MRHLIITFFLMFCSFTATIAQFGEGHIILPHCDYPIDMAVADLNEDGLKDLIIVSKIDNKLSWYKNEGNNTFRWETVISTEMLGIKRVFADDIDGDGDIDVLVFEEQSSITEMKNKILWWENNGEGIFLEQHLLSIGNPLSIPNADLVDLDQDGDKDLLVLNEYEQAVEWLENYGEGEFSVLRFIGTAASNVETVQARDFDGDGDLDIFVSGATNMGIFYNTGNQSFDNFSLLQENSSSPFLGSTSADILLEDLEGDGDVDIVYTSDSETMIYWRENNGTGSFSTPISIANQTNSSFDISSLVLMDVNQDGMLDLLAARADSQIEWFEQTVSGSFQLAKTIPTSDNVTELFLNDFNNDNQMDIFVLAGFNDGIEWLENKGNGDFYQHWITSNSRRETDLEFGDLNGDGVLDLCSFIKTYERPLVWYENDGNQNLSLPTIVKDMTGRTLKEHVLRDWDGDGDLDILASTEDFGQGTIWWYKNSGNGSFEEIELTTLQSASEWLVSDLDGDQTLDLIVRELTDIFWYSNLGNGLLGTKQTVANNSFNHNITKIEDINNDGTKDILIQQFTDIGYHANLGNGNFGEYQHLVEINDETPLLLSFDHDMDKDGRIDLVTADVYKVYYYKNLGNGAFAERQTLIEEIQFSRTLADIDDDGDTDVIMITLGQSSEYILAYYQNDANTFTGPYTIADLPFNDGLMNIHVQDLDNNEEVEIIVTSDWAQQMFVFKNTPHGNFIKGIVFLDTNENQQKDEGEIGLINQLLNLEPTANTTFTNFQGGFFFDVLPNDYQLSHIVNGLWEWTGPASYDITVEEGTPLPSYLFGLKPARILPRVQPFLCANPTRCNTETTYYLNYTNTGTTIANGTITLEADELMSFVSSSPEPTSIEGQTLIWNFSELHPYHENKIQLQFQIPDFNSMGEILETQATVQLFNDNQELIYSKSTDNKSEIRCSYDPNDKLARSNLLGQSEFAYLADTILYTVRFQNTGNDTAFNIRIEDILDKKLDWITFHPITASHDYRTELNRETGLVTFHFDDIMLPDSTTDKEGSNGFVMFGIASLPDLQDKIEVDNTASIFFDFNPPIITNTATLTLIEQVETDIEVLENGASIRVFPNPFSDYTTIEVSGLSAKDDYRLEVMDILGRKVRELKIENGKVRLERGDLESGLYLIRVLTDENRVLESGKVLVE